MICSSTLYQLRWFSPLSYTAFPKSQKTKNQLQTNKQFYDDSNVPRALKIKIQLGTARMDENYKRLQFLLHIARNQRIYRNKCTCTSRQSREGRSFFHFLTFFSVLLYKREEAIEQKCKSFDPCSNANDVQTLKQKKGHSSIEKMHRYRRHNTRLVIRQQWSLVNSIWSQENRDQREKTPTSNRFLPTLSAELWWCWKKCRDVLGLLNGVQEISMNSRSIEWKSSENISKTVNFAVDMIKRRRSSPCRQPQSNSDTPKYVSQSKHSVGVLKFSPTFQDPSWIGNVKIVLKHWSKKAVLTVHEKVCGCAEGIFAKQKREDVHVWNQMSLPNTEEISIDISRRRSWKKLLLYWNIYGNLVFPINHRYFAEISVWNATFELRQNFVFVLSVLSVHKLGQIFLSV